MNNKVEDRTRWWVSYMSSRLWAYNQKNTIVINPDAPRDIEWKLYRNPDDANAYVVAQNPDPTNKYQLVYWPWSYNHTHTLAEFTHVLWTQLWTLVDTVVADLDFLWTNFLDAIISWIQMWNVDVWSWKIIACLWWWVSQWTIEWVFAWLWWAWLNTIENVDASNWQFIFSTNFEWIDSDLSCWWDFSNSFIENCVLWDSEFENFWIVWWSTASPTATFFQFFNCRIDNDFMESIPAWAEVICENCQFNWNFTNVADLILINCSWEWNWCVITNDGWNIFSAWLEYIDIDDLSWWRSANVWQLINNQTFNVLTGSETQALFEEVDWLLWSSSWSYYISLWATPSWNLYWNWNNLYNASNGIFWLKTVYVWNTWMIPVMWNWVSYDLKDYTIKSYISDPSLTFSHIFSISTWMWSPLEFSLPSVLDNVTLNFMNNYWSADYFWNYETSTWYWYHNIEMKNNSLITSSWTQSSFMIWDGWKWTMTMKLYNNSRISSFLPLFTLYDNTSFVDIHLYDNSRLEWNVVSSIFSNVPWSSTKNNVRIHIHSPNVYIDPTFLQNVTVIFYWYINSENLFNQSSVATDTWSITDMTFDDTLKQATFESTWHWLSIGDWVEIWWVITASWSVDNPFLEIVDVPSADEFVVQYWSLISPWSYVSWWTWTLRTVFVLWTIRDNYMDEWQWLNFLMNFYNNNNNNNKRIWLFFQDTEFWNVAQVFDRSFNAADGNNTNVFFKWSAQMHWSWSLWASTEVSIYDWTSTHEAQISQSWLSLLKSRLVLVLDWVDAWDVVIKNLSCNPV